jgi:coenzyme F420 hydrogenase subunit beta
MKSAKVTSSRIGVVATPCQALALARMRVHPQPGDEERVKKLALVIGLFCGWALSFKELSRLIKKKPGQSLSKGWIYRPVNIKSWNSTRRRESLKFPWKKYRPACVRAVSIVTISRANSPTFRWVPLEAPKDGTLTGVGTRCWCERIKGQALLDLARSRGILEFKAVPPENLNKLKAASLGKKNTCMVQLEKVSGRKDDLIYTRREAVLCQ